MAKLMAMDALRRFMQGKYMMETGIWTSCMEKENSFGTLELALTKETSKTGRELAMEPLLKETSRDMKERFRMASFMGEAS